MTLDVKAVFITYNNRSTYLPFVMLGVWLTIVTPPTTPKMGGLCVIAAGVHTKHNTNSSQECRQQRGVYRHDGIHQSSRGVGK